MKGGDRVSLMLGGATRRKRVYAAHYVVLVDGNEVTFACGQRVDRYDIAPAYPTLKDCAKCWRAVQS